MSVRVDSRYRSVWLREDPVLPDGVIGLDRADNSTKLGDGVKKWTELPYLNQRLNPATSVPVNSPYVTKDELAVLVNGGSLPVGTGGGGTSGGGTGDVTTAQLNAAVALLQDKATAATDTELSAAVATLNSALATKQAAATAATDAELAAAVALLQDKATAATDAELASAIATVNASLTGKQDAATAATDAELASAVSTLQDKATATTDDELAAAVSTLNTAISARQLAATAATDDELASAVALLQDKATAATDAELASAVATLNASLTGKQDAATAATDAELAAGLASVSSPVIASQALTVSYALTAAYTAIPNWQVQVPANSGEVEIEVPEGLLFNINTGTNPAGTKFTFEAKIVDEGGATVGYCQKALFSSAATAQAWVDTIPLAKVVPTNPAIKIYSVMARMAQVGTNGALSTIFTAQSGFTNPTLRARR